MKWCIHFNLFENDNKDAKILIFVVILIMTKTKGSNGRP